jgi:predicted GIY-YIG superfamily endonuclease
MLKHLPKSPGIYQIKCVITEKIYIGSATNIYNRCGQHRRNLRFKKHQNSHLQSAWDKYGEDKFEFSVLELTSRKNLLDAEQAWLNKTCAFDKHKGYNIFRYAGSPGDEFARTWDGFIDPQGNPVTIYNLFDFCRQNNLDFPSMHRLAKGKSKLKSYKGWSHVNSVRQREYIKTYEGFIDPQGNAIGSIRNLAAFCRENNLEKSHMVAVAHGRLYSHKGWTYNNGREKRGFKTYRGFINPQGERVMIINLQSFCRNNNLNIVHMRNLISGKRKSHKGWKWDLENE